MNGLQWLGMLMLVVMLFAIFIGIPISFTLLFLAIIFGFLGLGAQPPMPEWGRMLADAQRYVRDAPYIGIFPGLAITLLVLGFNLTGDGLRDALDPTLGR